MEREERKIEKNWRDDGYSDTYKIYEKSPEVLMKTLQKPSKIPTMCPLNSPCFIVYLTIARLHFDQKPQKHQKPIWPFRHSVSKNRFSQRGNKISKKTFCCFVAKHLADLTT
jgi:hypothetical protein